MSQNFESLVEKHPKLVDRAIAPFFPPPGNDLSDLWQCAFVGLWKAAEKFNPRKGDFAPFALKTMRNNVRDLIRSSKSDGNQTLNTATSLDEAVFLDEAREVTRHEVVKNLKSTNPEESLLALEWLEEFGGSYGELSQERREAYDLVVIRGLSRDEAADRTGKSNVQIKNRVQEARSLLRESVPESPI